MCMFIGRDVIIKIMLYIVKKKINDKDILKIELFIN